MHRYVAYVYMVIYTKIAYCFVKDKVQERLEIFSLYLEKNIFTPDGALADETLKRTGR